MSLPEYPWPYILYSLSLSGFIAIWALVKMINGKIDSNIVELKKDWGGDERRKSKKKLHPPSTKSRYKIKQFGSTKEKFNKRINILLYALISLAFASILHICFYFINIYIDWFSILLFLIDSLVWILLLYIALLVANIFLSIKRLFFCRMAENHR